VGPIRGLWRLLDGKVESGLMSDLELRGVSPHPCRLRTDRLAPVDKFEMCTDASEMCNRYSMVVARGRMR
jgi:hypothetical protein